MRGVEIEDKRMLQVAEQRSPEYLDELAALFEDVAGEPVSVSATNIYLSAANKFASGRYVDEEDWNI